MSLVPRPRRSTSLSAMAVQRGHSKTIWDSASEGSGSPQQILRDMKAIYPDLFAYLDGVKTDLENSPEGKRYVRSIRGRRRGFTHPGELTETGRGVRPANAVVQMLEADVFKKTILELDKAFKGRASRSRWYSCSMTGFGSRVLSRSGSRQRP